MKRRTWKCRGCSRRIASPFYTVCDACSDRAPRGLAALLAALVLLCGRIGGAT